ncbi:hypothetical protein RD792_014521 [Penstemon davidsonii]|uniref:Pectinesterase catalytic domain-containing protein n=1 Tax=Penstemon davidsonii TaxID=160366 RepID=A0ABR0CQ85_9LAMI|nr:hypothetical protein RD792_014521 [Penstemon davidsonii]
MAQSIGFNNTAGPITEQAVRVYVDLVVFLNYRIEGYQDTLLLDRVEKTTRISKERCTTQGKDKIGETTELVIHNCSILVVRKIEPGKRKFKSYLGRQWKKYSTAIVMESNVGDFVSPEGWLERHVTIGLNTPYYSDLIIEDQSRAHMVE